MYYVLVMLAVVCIAANSVLTNAYRLLRGDATDALRRGIPVAFVTTLFFLTLNLFRIEWSAFSLWMAVGLAALSVGNNFLLFIGFSKGNMSLIVMFQMLGTMLLPFLYGVAVGNECTAFQIVGIATLILSLLLPVVRPRRRGENPKQKIRASFPLLCAAVFFISGGIGILSYLHSNSALAVSETGFCILLNFMCGVWSVLLLAGFSLCARKTRAPVPDKTRAPVRGAARGGKVKILLAVLITASAVMGGLSYLFQLMGASHLPATALYPMVTGGTIVLTALAGRVCFREKQSPSGWLSVGIAFLGTVMFVF